MTPGWPPRKKSPVDPGSQPGISTGGGWRPRSCSCFHVNRVIVWEGNEATRQRTWGDWWFKPFVTFWSLRKLKSLDRVQLNIPKKVTRYWQGSWILKPEIWVVWNFTMWYWNHLFEGQIILSHTLCKWLDRFEFDILHKVSSLRVIVFWTALAKKPLKKYCQLKNLHKDRVEHEKSNVYLPDYSKWPKLIPKRWRLPTTCEKVVEKHPWSQKRMLFGVSWGWLGSKFRS